jgi:Xaa-Pro aminopeptidase
MPPTARSVPVAFTTGDYGARMTRALDDALAAGLSGLVITPGPDLAWLTGYQPHLTERLTMLVLSPDQEPTMLVPLLERRDAEESGGAPLMSIVDWMDGNSPYEAARALLRPDGQFGISDSAWAMHLIGLQQVLPDSRYRSLTDCLPMLRAAKDPGELERLEAAGAAVDAAYHDIIGMRFAGRRETDLAADLAALMRQHGHEQIDFAVVGSGPNGANPHHGAGDRLIQPGDTVVLDFGGLVFGYGSDTTRTVCVGEPQARTREVHAVVMQAQQAAVEAVRPGVTCEEIDRTARELITDAGYGDYFIHRTGHGIGMTTHEPPYIVKGETQPLVPGMCFSVEPGIYLPEEFGVRIEDIVTVTDDGVRRFNNTSRVLQIVE